MKKRTVSILVLFLGVLLLLSACGSEKTPEPTVLTSEATSAPTTAPETTAPTTVPTTEPPPPPFLPLSLQEQNRIYNASHYFEHDGRIYSNFFDRGQRPHFGYVEKGHKMTEYVQLLADPVAFCEFIDGELYVLTAQTPNSALYRCSPDMSTKEPLLSLPNWLINQEIQYFEGYFYYTDINDNYRYYRISKDGGQPELVLDKEIYYPLIHDGWLLFQDDNDGECLCWMELETGATYKINSIVTHHPYFDGEYIYFYSTNENEGMYRIRHDGTEQVKISDKALYAGYAINEEYIYFVEDVRPYLLFRMRRDGSEVTQLGTEPYNQNPYLVDDTVFLQHNSDTMNYFYAYKYLDAETGEYRRDLSD